MAKKTSRKGDAVNKKRLLSDLNKTLKKHGISAKVSTLSLTSKTGAICTCPDGTPGVLRVVGGKVVCVCDG